MELPQALQFKLPPTNDPMFRIFCGFSIVGTSVNVYKALAYFCPERLVDPTSPQQVRRTMAKVR
jgi:hypothetical protein